MSKPTEKKSIIDFQRPFIARIKRSLLTSCIFLTCTALAPTLVSAQTLTISSAGQTGSSGTNWSSAGTNPVTITATGNASINTSVIEGYINSGISVILNNNNAHTSINSNISKTSGANASLTFKDIGSIKISANVNIGSTSNALNVILWADSDISQGATVLDFIFCDAGSSISSNGGKIVMAGGPDNGSNGGVSGDGIPDGFAWNGSNSTDQNANQYGGLTLGPRGGTGTVVNLQSNGGDIILRGATSNSNSYPGVTSQGNLKIVSGTGQILMYGKSTTGHGVELTYGAAPSIAIHSSSTSSPAISLKGNTTATGYQGFWASNNVAGSILIQSSATNNGGVSIEGTNPNGGGITLGVANTNINTQVLSEAGTIQFIGQGSSNLSFLLYGDVYIGNRKDANAVQSVVPVVSASNANIFIQANDQYSFSTASGKTTNIRTTGTFRMEAFSTGYTGTISWVGNPVFGTNFSSISLGKSTENYSVDINHTLTATGDITAYTSNFALGNAVGLVSSGAGNISIYANGSVSTAGTSRRSISTVNGNINLYADADSSGNGGLNIDYLTFNPGSGTTTLRAETMTWVTAANTDKPYFNGTGPVKIESSDASFQDVSTAWFVFDQDGNGMSGLTIGKPTNTGIVTHETTTLNISGAIALYGARVILNANLTSSGSGDIFIKANNSYTGAASIDGTASILKTAGTGTLTMQSQARLNTGTIAATGTGVLNVVLWSDYGNINNGGVAVGSVSTNGGHFWLGGSNSNGGSYTWNGLTVGDGPSVGSVNNNHNSIDFFGPVTTTGGNVLVWGGSGYSAGISGIGVYAGASINSGTGNVTLIADQILLNNLTLTSTGVITLLPDGGSYPGNFSWAGTVTGGNFNMTGDYDGLVINNIATIGGLAIGYYNGHLSSATPVVQTNSSTITISNASTVAGPISLYAPSLAVNASLTSTGSGDISLRTNSLSITAATLSSSGNLIIEPLTTGTTIGLAGGAGALSISAANFNTHFADGFTEIRIGSADAGLITLGSAITLKDNLRLITAGNLALNETLTIGDNNLRFLGGNIVAAAGKFVKTQGSGKLFMNINNSSNKLYPLGITDYTPVTITNNTGINDEFYATASGNVYFNGGTSGTPVGWPNRINITWNIGNTSASTGSGSINLGFAWNAANVTGTLASPRLVHHNGSIWSQQSNSTVFDLAARTLNYSGYTGSFSPFAMAEANTVLPVTWSSFTAKRAKDDTELKWETASEQNNDYFEVQRREEGTDFITVGRVAASKNPSAGSAYQFYDRNAPGNFLYYRLKQVDVDGRSRYSAVVTVNSVAATGYKIANISGSNQIVLTAPQTVQENTVAIILDGNGRQVSQQKVQAGRTIIQTGSLLAGSVYYIKIIHGNHQLYSSTILR